MCICTHSKFKLYKKYLDIKITLCAKCLFKAIQCEETSYLFPWYQPKRHLKSANTT